MAEADAVTKPKFLTTDRALRDGFVLHPKDEEILAATKALGERPLDAEMQAVVEQGGFMPAPAIQETAIANTFYYEVMITFLMGIVQMEPDLVKIVTEWRVEARYSWRMIAQRVSDRMGGHVPWTPPWNQMAGMAACTVAAAAAQADPNEAPWN